MIFPGRLLMSTNVKRKLRTRKASSLFDRIDPCSREFEHKVAPKFSANVIRELGKGIETEKIASRLLLHGSKPRAVAQIALFIGSADEKIDVALVLARRHKRLVYRIDLLRIVGKYIGQTEKNLTRVMDAAHNSEAILFLDDADALFSGQTDTGDGPQPCTAIQTTYILDRLARYDGLVILSVKAISAADEAYARRLYYVTKFRRRRS